jgi:hypothetical protein
MKHVLRMLGLLLTLSVGLMPAATAQSGVAGTWLTTDFANVPNLIDLQVIDGSRVTGTINRDQQVLAISDGSVSGNTVTFKVVVAGGDRTISYRGTLNGTAMSFTRSAQVRPGGASGGVGIFGAGGPMEFTATRDNAAGAAIPRALFGNWKVNMARSTFDPGPGPRPTVPDHMNIVARPGGELSYVLVGVNVEGTPVINTASLKADGRDYPRHSAATLTAMLDSEAATGLTTALRVIDARNFEWTNKTNGTVTQTLRWTVSADGSTLTHVVRNVDAQGQVTSTNTYLVERVMPTSTR